MADFTGIDGRFGQEYTLELTNRKLRKVILDTKKALAKKTGLLCFCENWSNPVQWSHYADKHKGICLGFDVPDNLLVQVLYSSKRLSQEANEIMSGGVIDENLILRLLSTKFYHWKYEREYRYFCELNKKGDKSFYYANFSNVIDLKQVIVGGTSKIRKSEIVDALGNLCESIEVFKARPAFKTFRVVRNKNESRWA